MAEVLMLKIFMGFRLQKSTNTKEGGNALRYTLAAIFS